MDVKFEDLESLTAAMCRRQLWRCRPTFELEDLLGEAWLVYDRVRRKYERTVESALHFRKLYAKSLMNHIHSLARQASESRTFVSVATDCSDYEPECSDILDDLHDEDQGSPLYCAALKELPVSPEEALAFLESAGSDGDGWLKDRTPTRELLIKEFGVDIIQLIEELPS